MTQKAPPVKKVPIFPIEAVLEDAQGPQKVHILKLNLQGMMLEVFNAAYRPQLPVKLKFTVPFSNKPMEEECLIIKTYNQLSEGKNPRKIYLIEVHYKKLKQPNLDVITEFLTTLEAKIRKQREDKSKN